MADKDAQERLDPSNEHELLVGGIVRAALELAILRGDLRMDNGASFDEMSESDREDVITDTWNAMNGEGTCDDRPVKELTAIYRALAGRSRCTCVEVLLRAGASTVEAAIPKREGCPIHGAAGERKEGV